MRSLRSRLILGSALVAVVPLAVVMVLLSQRIESLVRAQAAERLDGVLGGLEARLRADGERTAERLEILGRDPTLKRLYLLRPGSRELSEYLEERRFLLGLDFLLVADTNGTVAGEAPAGGTGAPRGAGLRGPVVEPLDGEAGLAMAASAPIRYEGRATGVAHGGVVLDSAFLARLEQAGSVELVLSDASGRVRATTLPGAPEAAVALPSRFERVRLSGRPYLGRSLPLRIGVPPHARVTGLVSTASADRTIGTVQVAAGLLGAVGLCLAVLLGVLWSSQVSRPVERLAAFADRVAQGRWDEPLTLRGVRELQTLVASLDRMRRDLQGYRERLVTSERQAAWSQMARTVAHEIKNPLTPIAVSVSDLRRSYELGRSDFPQILDQAVRTVGAEIENMKRLLQEFSDFARFPAPQLAPCRLSRLLAELEALYPREVAGGRLVISRPGHDPTLHADAGQLRQALVNLLKNGFEALESGGTVTVRAEIEGGKLEIAVSDTGPGLTAEQRARLFVPGFTTKAQGSGLGLTIVERIVNDHRGTLSVDAGSGPGTTFRIRLPVEAS